MRRGALVLALGVLTALLTALVGWWTVPLVGAGAGLLARGRGGAPMLDAAVGGALGWALLLLWDAAHGPVAALAQRVAGVMQLPPSALIGVTLVFPALLAGAAAGVVWRPAGPQRWPPSPDRRY